MATIPIARKKAVAQSRLRPERISSRKMRVKKGVERVTKATNKAKMKVSQKPSLAPRRFFLTYDRMLVWCPSGANDSVGVKANTTPVNDLLNSSIGISTGPAAGSFRQTL